MEVDDLDLNTEFDRIARIPRDEDRLTEYDRLVVRLRSRVSLEPSNRHLVRQLTEVRYQRDGTLVHSMSPIPRAPPTCGACGVRGHTRAQRKCPQHPRNQEYLTWIGGLSR